jgi:TolB-like protein/tetratricopeptide (TPR) repeat protein
MTSRPPAFVRFTRELRRRRVFATAGLYIVGAWLVMQAADVFFPGWGIPDSGINVLLVAAVTGFPLALAFGWFFNITVHGIRRTMPAGPNGTGEPQPLRSNDYLVLGVLLLVAGVIVSYAVNGILALPRTAATGVEDRIDLAPMEKLPNSIAVLPFANVSDDPSNEFFCDGISEEILHKLGEFQSLHVIGRTSSFAFKGSDYRIPKISSLLGVSYLLQGSVRKYGDQLRITAQLVDGSGAQIWSSAFDRRLEDIFAIQTEIADVVATTVVPKIVPHHAEAYEPDLKAYQHYLLGREYLHRRQVPDAREELAKAVELDPDFAKAQAEYAIAMTMWGPDDAQLAAAEMAIERALELAPGLPRARAAQGLRMIYVEDFFDPAAAEKILRGVLADDPNMVDAINWLSTALFRQQKYSEAMDWLERGLRIDPMHPAIAGNLAWGHFERGHLARTEEILLRLSELPEPSALVFSDLVRYYFLTGRLVDMMPYSRRLAMDPVFGTVFRASRYGQLALSHAVLNDWEQAEHWLGKGLEYPPGKGNREEWIPWVRLHYLPELWRGRYQKALENYRRVMAAEGLSLAEMRYEYGELLALAGDHAGAREMLAPLENSAVELGAIDLEGQDEMPLRQTLAWSYIAAGQRDKADRLLREIDVMLTDIDSAGQLHRSDHLHVYALNAVLMEKPELALERLRRAVEAGWLEYYVTHGDPRWGSLADNPAYQALMAEVKADVDRQRAEIESIEAEEDFAALFEKVLERKKEVANERAGKT